MQRFHSKLRQIFRIIFKSLKSYNINCLSSALYFLSILLPLSDHDIPTYSFYVIFAFIFHFIPFKKIFYTRLYPFNADVIKLFIPFN
jgi:hypothetical protein